MTAGELTGALIVGVAAAAGSTIGVYLATRRGSTNKPPSVLPESGLWDSVYESAPVTRRGLLHRMRCEHEHTTEYTRVDHRAGAGWMADNYAGTACCDCGAVLVEKQVY